MDKLILEFTRTHPAGTVTTHLGQLVASLALVLGSHPLKLILVMFRQILTSQARTLEPIANINIYIDSLLRHNNHLVVG
jgi:hypothetical protein